MKLTQYKLNGYTLHVTQNQNIQADNSDIVTIAIQEKTIQDLHTQMASQQEQLSKLEQQLTAQLDCRKLSADASAIFVKLSNCGCGVMSDATGDYLLLTASAQEPLTPEEEQAIRNWLKTASGLPRVELQICFT